MTCLSSTDSHEIPGLTVSLFVFLSPSFALLCSFQPFTPHTRSWICWFSDKKLERGK